MKTNSRLSKILKNECSGWKKWEIIWLLFSTTTILSLSLFWHDSLIAILAAIAGVWCVVLTGKGKISCFVFGTLNVLFYVCMAFNAKYYGTVMLNMLYYLPCNIIGIITWKKHISNKNHEVIKKKMQFKSSLILYFFTAICIVIYGSVLNAIGGSLPFLDSMSTVISIVAQLLCIKRLMEQWILWICVDAVTVLMWAIPFFKGTADFAMLLMWTIFLVNAVIMYIKWNKEANANV